MNEWIEILVKDYLWATTPETKAITKELTLMAIYDKMITDKTIKSAEQEFQKLVKETRR